MGYVSLPARFSGNANTNCDETNGDATGRSGSLITRYGIVSQFDMNEEA